MFGSVVLAVALAASLLCGDSHGQCATGASASSANLQLGQLQLPTVAAPLGLPAGASAAASTSAGGGLVMYTLPQVQAVPQVSAASVNTTALAQQIASAVATALAAQPQPIVTVPQAVAVPTAGATATASTAVTAPLLTTPVVATPTLVGGGCASGSCGGGRFRLFRPRSRARSVSVTRT